MNTLIQTTHASFKTNSRVMTSKSIWMTVLILLLFFSAFTIVYVKDLNRRLFIQYQTLQEEKIQEMIEWGKLLLEQSTWSTQSRIQQIAQHQLNMVIPTTQDVVLLETQNVLAAR